MLQDATNLGVSCNSIVDHHSRAYKYKAVERWQEQMPKACKPRGDPAAGPPARTDNNNREHVSMAKITPPAENIEATSLYRIFHHHKALFDLGKTSISNFIEGNVIWEMKKAFAIQILVTGMNTWGLGILDASKLAADVLGVSPESIRRWANHYFVSLGSQFSSDNVTHEVVQDILSSSCGLTASPCDTLILDEEFQLKAKEYVRANGHRKGAPNMTSEEFATWVNTEFSVSVHEETARKWLHRLGFSQKNHHKGVYFNGHEGDDVVQSRQQFLDKLLVLDEKTRTCDINPNIPDGEKPLIRVVHNESTFYANADQSRYWCDNDSQVLKQKSLGSLIMVSDFIDEIDGYLHHDGNFSLAYQTSPLDPPPSRKKCCTQP